MKIIFMTCTVMFFIVFLCHHIQAESSAKASPGERAFAKHCAVCHANGGNIINTSKPLYKKVLEANGFRKPSDIVRNMRNPGPAMTRFDEKTIPDKEAMAIAEYILKTF
jgi:cytochrome c6